MNPTDFTPEWLAAPYEIRYQNPDGELVHDPMPPFRFTEENIEAAMEAMARNDKVALRRLRVPQFEGERALFERNSFTLSDLLLGLGKSTSPPT